MGTPSACAFTKCPNLHLHDWPRGLVSRTDDEAASVVTQVREGNFSGEIADGISSPGLVLYRTGCQGRCGVFRLRSDAQNGSYRLLRLNPLAHRLIGAGADFHVYLAY